MKLFNLTQTSFENFDESIRTYLAKTFNSIGYQYTHNQIFGVIFDGIKGIMQNAMFYIEDALTEQNILTATRKKSVYSLAKISGYEPYYGSAACGTLIGKMIMSNSYFMDIDKIYINNYTRVVNKVTGINYLIFLNSNRYVIYSKQPLLSHEFKIVQGMWNTYQGAAMGGALQRFSIDASGLFDKSYIKVLVNGEEWTAVSNLYDMSYQSKEYMITIGYENVFDILFGNGIYGKMPEAGDTIQIQYLSHSGTVGNISSYDASSFSFLDSGYDSNGNIIDLNNYMILSLNNVVSGGTNADSIEFVRTMVGTNSRSEVLASEDNFKLFFKRFSFIGNINCWSEQNSMCIYVACTSNLLNTIKTVDEYFKLTDKRENYKYNNILLTNDQKVMIQNTLKNSNKSFAGLTIKFQDPEIRRYALFCYVKYKNIYSKQDIEESIKESLGLYFLNLKDDFSFIPKSDLINIGSLCHPDIESFDIDIISELAEETFYNGYYYKYVLSYIDSEYKFIKKKVYYESDTTPGLDNFGNIKLTSNLEIPILGGGFKYYPDKQNMNKSNSILLDAITIIWI